LRNVFTSANDDIVQNHWFLENYNQHFPQKSRRAKGLDPLNSSLKENETNNIPSGPKKKRKKTGD
jgi:hypothetical protein